MIAYNKIWIRNVEKRAHCNEAFGQGIINDAALKAAFEKYPVGFYTPNFFIALGLLLLTLVVVLFSFGIVLVFFRDAHTSTLGVMGVLTGIACFAVLEKLISSKKYYREGIDEGLLWGGVALIFFGISLPHNLGGLSNSVLLFLLCIFGLLRYGDRLIGFVMYASAISIIFFLFIRFGPIGKSIIPFAVMLFSLLTCMVADRWFKKGNYDVYNNSLLTMKYTSLLFLYAAGNYFVERELNNSFFNLNLGAEDKIPMGWLFWILTVVIPVVYLLIGIKKKDRPLIWLAIVLLAVVVFTIRFYHAVLSLEATMTVAGVLLIGIAYFLLQYLKEPKNGFTSKELSGKDKQEKHNIEALIISETFSPGQTGNRQDFGGGDFGGGGASGNY